MTLKLVDPLVLQHRLFAELSRMFGAEVPLYDKSLLVNRVCNETACALLAELHHGFVADAALLEQTGGERHGAIRIGRADEYRWVARYFAAFGMEPHNFYDMTQVGAKSQPIIATAFRSRMQPDHRVFCSLLMTDFFAPPMRVRLEALLAQRKVFSSEVKALLEKNEQQGGLEESHAAQLIHEGVTQIFRWTGRARDHAFYQELCAAGYKIAADIACFDSHHLNHLTPNTLVMDLFTAAMKFCLGELDEATFRTRAVIVLGRWRDRADRDFLLLNFKYLTATKIATWQRGEVSASRLGDLVDALARRLQQPDLVLSVIKHAGFKDTTEGPPDGTPVLLRQDAYKALTEPVEFREADGTRVRGQHTARFGEIEQRGYAMTPRGRALYDSCLVAAESARSRQPELAKHDFLTHERVDAEAFAEISKQLSALLDQGLVYATYSATADGLAAAREGKLTTTNLRELRQLGYVEAVGLRYEDFLPVSAAGIFASNLNQYGTQSTSLPRPAYTQEMLEEILGRRIVDPNATYAAVDAVSRLATFGELGLLEQLDPAEHARLTALVPAATPAVA